MAKKKFSAPAVDEAAFGGEGASGASAKAGAGHEGAKPRVLTNCTDTARGICLSRRVLKLQPREMRELSIDEYDEVKAMFRTETFQRFVDSGIFRLSGLSDDEQSATVKTPEPPAELTSPRIVDMLQTPVAVVSAPRVVEHQPGGPLE